MKAYDATNRTVYALQNQAGLYYQRGQMPGIPPAFTSERESAECWNDEFRATNAARILRESRSLDLTPVAVEW